MNKNLIFFLIFIFFGPIIVQGQKLLRLEDAILLAKNQSTAAKRAETRRENRYWSYRVFRSNYVPQLSLSGILPNFNNRVIPVSQPDGSIAFRNVRNMSTDLNLKLEQTIAATGGSVFVSSSINRFQDLENDFTRYGGDPAIIGFEQPLFSFNPLKWDKKIEPLRYEESKREFVEEFEFISREASRRFFDLLLAQISLQIAQQNVNNNDTVYKIAQGRYELGKIPENDLLQLELNLMNSRQSVSQAKLDYETAQLSLRSFLGISTDVDLKLVIPDEFPQIEVDENVALAEAKKNRQEAISFKRRRLEADRDVARATGETGLNANLFGSFGLTNQGDQVPDIYQRPEEQQQVRLGFAIPIIDWGRQKSRVKTAQANQQLVQYSVQQDEIDFNQEVIVQVKRFGVLQEQVVITQKADDISQRRYAVAKNRYLIGKISITDLSLALTEKDRAKRDYINSLGNYWQAYYNLRQLTLYDFVEDEPLYKPEVE
ncbi:MAG: TolC family protein [Candidatus Cyclobacteriaceae bacterium M2_1C_046]